MKEINTSWIPAFAGMTKRSVQNDREVAGITERVHAEQELQNGFRIKCGMTEMGCAE